MPTSFARSGSQASRGSVRYSLTWARGTGRPSSSRCRQRSRACVFTRRCSLNPNASAPAETQRCIKQGHRFAGPSRARQDHQRSIRSSRGDVAQDGAAITQVELPAVAQRSIEELPTPAAGSTGHRPRRCAALAAAGKPPRSYPPRSRAALCGPNHRLQAQRWASTTSTPGRSEPSTPCFQLTMWWIAPSAKPAACNWFSTSQPGILYTREPASGRTGSP